MLTGQIGLKCFVFLNIFGNLGPTLKNEKILIQTSGVLCAFVVSTERHHPCLIEEKNLSLAFYESPRKVINQEYKLTAWKVGEKVMQKGMQFNFYGNTEKEICFEETGMTGKGFHSWLPKVFLL